MAAPGWKATGLLQPLWNRYKGGRDALATAVGSSGTALSGVNSGSKNLGHDLARRLADELGVTVFDLGAPAAEARRRGERRVIDRLAEVEDALETLGPDLKALASLPERVLALEQQAQSRRRTNGPR